MNPESYYWTLTLPQQYPYSIHNNAPLMLFPPESNIPMGIYLTFLDALLIAIAVVLLLIFVRRA